MNVLLLFSLLVGIVLLAVPTGAVWKHHRTFAAFHRCQVSATQAQLSIVVPAGAQDTASSASNAGNSSECAGFLHGVASGDPRYVCTFALVAL
jgi:hypothetical protein